MSTCRWHGDALLAGRSRRSNGNDGYCDAGPQVDPGWTLGVCLSFVPELFGEPILKLFHFSISSTVFSTISYFSTPPKRVRG